MKKFKIRSKTPEDIIKTKIPDDSKPNFNLPPKKKIFSKISDKKTFQIPSKSGLKDNFEHSKDRNNSLPKNVKEREKSKFIPRNNGKKTNDEKNNKKKNKSLMVITKKKPKKNKELKRFRNSLETPEKINAILSKVIKSKKPKKENKHDSPPKFSVNPPKTKIKDKFPQ